jgi:hypothetical protein
MKKSFDYYLSFNALVFQSFYVILSKFLRFSIINYISIISACFFSF